MDKLINTQTTNNTYDPFLQSSLINLITSATGEANKPYTPYTGARLAGFSPDELQAQGLIRSGLNKEQGYFDQASGALSSGLSQINNLQGRTTWNQQAADQYMNPFIQNVVNTTTDDATRNLQRQLTDQRSKQALTGSFGGSRGAIGQQNLISEGNRDLQSTLANLYKGGYENAQQQFNADRQFSGSLATLYGQAGEGLAGLGARQSAYRSGQTQDLMSAGTTQRNLAQANLNSAYGDWENQQGWNKNQMNYLSGILSGTPLQNFQTGVTQVSTPTYPTDTSGTLLGSISAGLGIAGNLGNAFKSVFGDSNAKAKGGLVKKYAGGGKVQKFNEGGKPRSDTYFEDISKEQLLNEYKNLAGEDPSRLRDFLSQALLTPGYGGSMLIGRGMDKAASGLSNLSDWLMTPRSERKGAPSGEAIAPEAFFEALGRASGESSAPTPSLAQQEPLPSLTNGLVGEPTAAQQTTPQGMSQQQESFSSEQPFTQGIMDTPPVDYNTNIADLFSRPEESFMDKMFSPNPLLMAGLGMMSANAQYNPYDTWANMAAGAKNALTDYEASKTQRNKADQDLMSSKAQAILGAGQNAETARSNRARESIDFQRLQETQRGNRALEELRRAEEAVKTNAPMTEKDYVNIVDTYSKVIGELNEQIEMNKGDEAVTSTLKQQRLVLNAQLEQLQLRRVRDAQLGFLGGEDSTAGVMSLGYGPNIVEK
jgi:hypothetical protein